MRALCTLLLLLSACDGVPTSASITQPLDDDGGMVSDCAAAPIDMADCWYGTRLIGLSMDGGASDFVLSAAWGAGAYVSILPAQLAVDQEGTATIHAGTGATVNPVATHPFHDGAYPWIPPCTAKLVASTDSGDLVADGGPEIDVRREVVSATTMAWRFYFVPTDGATYTVSWYCGPRCL